MRSMNSRPTGCVALIFRVGLPALLAFLAASNVASADPLFRLLSGLGRASGKTVRKITEPKRPDAPETQVSVGKEEFRETAMAKEETRFAWAKVCLIFVACVIAHEIWRSRNDRLRR
jgi:hypothetical protein